MVMSQNMKQLGEWLRGKLMIVSMTIPYGVVTSIFSVRGYKVRIMTISLNSSHGDIAKEEAVL